LLHEGKKGEKRGGSLVGVPIEPVVVKMSPEEIEAKRKEEEAATRKPQVVIKEELQRLR